MTARRIRKVPLPLIGKIPHAAAHILKLNELIMTQTKSIDSLQRIIEELRQELNNKQAEVDYLKAKLFGSSSEKCKSPFPGQMNLFEEMPDERMPGIIEPETINVSAHNGNESPKPLMRRCLTVFRAGKLCSIP